MDVRFLGEEEDGASGHAFGYETARQTDKPFPVVASPGAAHQVRISFVPAIKSTMARSLLITTWLNRWLPK